MTKNTAIFSAAFVNAVAASVDEYLHLDDLDNCVSAYGLADSKAFKPFKEGDGSPMHTERLRLMIMSCVSTGLVKGLDIRKGRNGGIFRTKAKRVAAKKPTTKKTEKPANNTQSQAPAAKEVKTETAVTAETKTGTDA